jgi:hypothetical protein
MPKDWRMCSPRSWPHRWFGVPLVEPRHEDPHPSAFEMVDPTWQPTDLPELLNYLDTAADLVTSAPMVACPFCAAGLSTAYWRSDGVWLWSNSLSHFVRDHRVWLPNAFVAHIREAGYQPAASGQVDWDNLPWPGVPEAAGTPARRRDRFKRWAGRALYLREG